MCDFMHRVDQYVTRTLGTMLGLPAGQRGAMSSLPTHLRRLLLREEEYSPQHRDQWDNWEHPFAENFLRQALWTPELDLWLKREREDLVRRGFALEPLWPKGRSFALCLTHDVDNVSLDMTWWQRAREVKRAWKAEGSGNGHRFLNAAKALAKSCLRPCVRCPSCHSSLDVSYGIEKELGVTASYFFTVYPVSKISLYDSLYAFGDSCRFLGKKRSVGEVMRWLQGEGFDVGLHGSYHSACATNLLAEQKEALESHLGHAIYTTRQHWLHWRFPLTPKLQAKAGFCADATLGYNRNVGFRAGTSMPFTLFDMEAFEELPLLEVPLVLMDAALMDVNGLELNSERGLSLSLSLLERVAEVQGCVTVLFHPDRMARPGVAKWYKRLIEGALERNAWVTNVNELRIWWKQREQRL